MSENETKGKYPHEGHRARLKKRFLHDNGESMEGHELLELLLFYVIPRRNTNEIAHALLSRFGKLADVFSASVFYGNRIEWNMGGGVHIFNAKFTTVTANQFDRAGGAQLKLCAKGDDGYCRNISVTGNTFNRSGSGEFRSCLQAEGYDNCHFFAEDCVNLVFSGNTLHAGRDGKDKDGIRHFGPDYGIVVKHLRSSLIKDNAMQGASVRQNVVDFGEHEEDVIIRDNLGSVMESEERWTAMLANKPVEFIRSYFDLPKEEQEELKNRFSR